MKTSVLSLVLLLVVAVTAKTVKEVVAEIQEQLKEDIVQLQSQIDLGLQKVLQDIREDLEAAKKYWVVYKPAPPTLLDSARQAFVDIKQIAVDDIKGTADALKFWDWSDLVLA